MKFVLFVVLSALLCAHAPHLAAAADVSRLEWGGFVIEDDTSNGWADYKYAASDDGNSITMSFAPLEAKADGATLESRAKLSGHYDISQPKLDSFAGYAVTIEGHVIKSSASVTRLVLNVGVSEQVIEWPAGSTVSEKFTRKIDIAIPADGRLPQPFKVGIEAFARKEGPSDAAYVSVDKLTIAATANPQVAAN